MHEWFVNDMPHLYLKTSHSVKFLEQILNGNINSMMNQCIYFLTPFEQTTDIIWNLWIESVRICQCIFSYDFLNSDLCNSSFSQ